MSRPLFPDQEDAQTIQMNFIGEWPRPNEVVEQDVAENRKSCVSTGLTGLCRISFGIEPFGVGEEFCKILLIPSNPPALALHSSIVPKRQGAGALQDASRLSWLTQTRTC